MVALRGDCWANGVFAFHRSLQLPHFTATDDGNGNWKSRRHSLWQFPPSSFPPEPRLTGENKSTATDHDHRIRDCAIAASKQLQLRSLARKKVQFRDRVVTAVQCSGMAGSREQASERYTYASCPLLSLVHSPSAVRPCTIIIATR